MISTPVLLLFYLAMAALGLGLCWGFDLGMPWVWKVDSPSTTSWTPTKAVLFGALIGLVVVALSNLLERYAQWAKRLSDAFSQMLGPLSMFQVFLFALMSSTAEEILFRGFLQRLLTNWPFDGGLGVAFGIVLSSLIFGGVHIGTDRKTFLPWTIMAIVLGALIAWSYWWTQHLLAPIILHFTINFLNLASISEKATSLEE